ncbi:hypothetical protein KAU11_05180, partial [Candidatus Babeliales bacterium]|nr:hypothetical protein [Candidatus Babeliales bacterium]
IYLGSESEPEMLQEASRVVLDAHREGLLALLWIYPKGKLVKDAMSEEMIAGAAGVGLSLGADFVKVYSPKSDSAQKSAEMLKQAVAAAGNTGVLCAGGVKLEKRVLLEAIHAQVNVAGSSGCAVGRNIFQRSLKEAVGICKGINAILHDAATVDEALALCG